MRGRSSVADTDHEHMALTSTEAVTLRDKERRGGPQNGTQLTGRATRRSRVSDELEHSTIELLRVSNKLQIAEPSDPIKICILPC
jgi:hypothetical protein